MKFIMIRFKAYNIIIKLNKISKLWVANWQKIKTNLKILTVIIYSIS